MHDLVHGDVKFDNSTIDDIVLLRSDFEPLYNLCVFVDDHDMGVTHIIRGEDHLNNAAKQKLLYEAMEWQVPQMAHIPLIHGADGAKLSKRHGATSVEEYKDEGYLPQSILSYILRLGWSNDNDEIISMQDAAKIFDTAQIGKSCSRIDFDKLKNINFHYIKQSDDVYLTDLVTNFLLNKGVNISQDSKELILKGMKGIKVRSHSVGELADYAKIYIASAKIEYSVDSAAILAKADKRLIAETISMLESLESFDEEFVKAQFMGLAEKLDVKLAVLMQPIRCLLTGLTGAPSVFEIISIIGRELTLNRLNMFYKI